MIFSKVEVPQRLVDQKEKFCWTGNYEDQHYRLVITNNEGIWFNGLLTMNSDTLFIRGFTKGNCHPIYYKLTSTDSIAIGPVEIWTRGISADTVDLKNYSENLSKIPDKLTLVKKKK